MSTAGGLIASQTLLLAKSGVKLITSTAAGQNQFKDSMSFFILFALVITAILQVQSLSNGRCNEKEYIARMSLDL